MEVDSFLDDILLLYAVYLYLCSEIQHLFYSKENDWGFSNFITMAVCYITYWCNWRLKILHYRQISK